MTNEQFTRIQTISDSGMEFIRHTLFTFGKKLPDFEKKMLEDSIMTLVQSERMDAAVKTSSIWLHHDM